MLFLILLKISHNLKIKRPIKLNNNKKKKLVKMMKLRENQNNTKLKLQKITKIDKCLIMKIFFPFNLI